MKTIYFANCPDCRQAVKTVKTPDGLKVVLHDRRNATDTGMDKRFACHGSFKPVAAVRGQKGGGK